MAANKSTARTRIRAILRDRDIKKHWVMLSLLKLKVLWLFFQTLINGSVAIIASFLYLFISIELPICYT